MSEINQQPAEEKLTDDERDFLKQIESSQAGPSTPPDVESQPEPEPQPQPAPEPEPAPEPAPEPKEPAADIGQVQQMYTNYLQQQLEDQRQQNQRLLDDNRRRESFRVVEREDDTDEDHPRRQVGPDPHLEQMQNQMHEMQVREARRAAAEAINSVAGQYPFVNDMREEIQAEFVKHKASIEQAIQDGDIGRAGQAGTHAMVQTVMALMTKAKGQSEANLKKQAQEHRQQKLDAIPAGVQQDARPDPEPQIDLDKLTVAQLRDPRITKLIEREMRKQGRKGF